MPASPFVRVDKAASDAIAAMSELGAEHVSSAMQAADGRVVGAMVITRDPGRAKDLLAMKAGWDAADEKPDDEPAADAPAAARHTPGQWHAMRGEDGSGAEHEWTVHGPDGSNDDFTIAVFHGPDAEANAHLSAAAPDLLAAVEAAYADLVLEECEQSSLGLRLAAVIAKAKGS